MLDSKKSICLLPYACLWTHHSKLHFGKMSLYHGPFQVSVNNWTNDYYISQTSQALLCCSQINSTFLFLIQQGCMLSSTSQSEVVLAAVPDFNPWSISDSEMLPSWTLLSQSSLLPALYLDERRNVTYSQTITHKTGHYHLHFSVEEKCSLPKVFRVSRWYIPN